MICWYRSSKQAADHRRCGIGHSIPDELYDPGMEGKTVQGVMDDYPQVRHHLEVDTDVDMAFLIDLQCAHDDAARAQQDMDVFGEKMKAVAELYGLTL